jgi:hypothetical protein
LLCVGRAREKEEIGIKRQGDLDAQVLKKPTKPKISSQGKKKASKRGEQKTGKGWGRRMAAKASIHGERGDELLLS